MDPSSIPPSYNDSVTGTPSSVVRKQGAGSVTGTATTSLNDRLNTDYVDVGGDESSMNAQVTRSITGFVGNYITPRHLLIVLRVLKAITFSFLALTVAADLMYIAFLEVFADREVKDLAGGRRDMTIRVYGLFLAAAAICIELDYTNFIKPFYGFKGFVPRGFLLFFISAITGAHPLHTADYSSLDIPKSAVVFQMVTSFILGTCAVIYFVFGCLCFDKFTSKAFLSTNDPLVSTAIPTPTAVPMEHDAIGNYRSPA